MTGPGRPFDHLLREAQAGEAAAFNDLYERYAARLKSFAAARGSDDAEAVANDVMLRAFQNIASFEGDVDGFVRWLFTIARNRLIDAHRAKSRRPAVVAAPIPETAQRSAEAVALDNLSVETVNELLSVLTVEQREVIALRLVQDLSLADVAVIVGRPVTAVKALQRRGLARLRQEMSNRGVS